MKAGSSLKGVQTVEVAADRRGQRLDNFLVARLPGVPKSKIYRIIRKGEVRVNGKRAKPMQKLAAGDQVRIPPVRLEENEPPRVPDSVVRDLENRILFENDELLVINKPAGMAVHGGSGLRWGVIDALRLNRPQIDLVHRLDRETSGILMLAKNHQALKHLHGKFKSRDTDKRYFALLNGLLREDKVIVDEPLLKQERSGERFVVVDPAGKRALTEFRRVESWRRTCLAEVILHTGRTHQIRAHAVHLDAAIAGDPKYSEPEAQEYFKKLGLKRMFLHAHALTVEDRQGEKRQFSCPMDDELRAVLDALE